MPDIKLDQRKRVPVLEGLFTMDEASPHLIGSCCNSCGTYYFPKQASFCRNPDCNSESFSEVRLSRFGKLWSFTNASYQPPEPYIAPDPFVPFAIAAVELDMERMIILGQVVNGIGVESLRVGMDMELVLQTISKDETTRKLVWKWKPLGLAHAHAEDD